MKKNTSKDQAFDVLLSEEQKKALKIDFSSLSKRMQIRLQKLRGEHVSETSNSKHNYQRVHQPA